MSIRNLPLVQHWDCHACTNCCREYDVPVTDEERERIAQQGWEKDPALGGLRPFVRYGPWWSRRYRLNHRPTGGCVFLDDNNRCRIHERHGAEAKPLACRLFPFVLAPAGDHWRAGVRFACPSAAADRGRPLTDHAAELGSYARLLEGQEGLQLSALPPPPLQGRQRLDWPDVNRVLRVVLEVLKSPADRVERRWRKCLALVALCRQANLDKFTGGRLNELLDLLKAAVDADVPRDPAAVPPPTWVGRVLFRQAAAVYGRKDRGEQRGPVTRGKLSLLRSGWRFARGRGPVPRVNARLGDVTFAQLDAPAGPLPTDAEAVLGRYYHVKVGSLQFCGATNFGLGVWEGLESLALTLPLILWLARGIPAASTQESITHATSIVDDHFGYNRALRGARYRMAFRLLARRGELERLIAWYSR